MYSLRLSGQFKKGQSGNPTGKAKKEASLKAQLKKILAEEVVVHQNGVPVTMTKGEVMLNAAVTKSMKGDMPCAKYVRDTLGPEPEASAAAPEIEVKNARDIGRFLRSPANSSASLAEPARG